MLVVATNGEHGEVPEDLRDGETLVDRRRAETEASAAALGVDRVVWLGYRDSGMTGWEQNARPLVVPPGRRRGGGRPPGRGPRGGVGRRPHDLRLARELRPPGPRQGPPGRAPGGRAGLDPPGAGGHHEPRRDRAHDRRSTATPTSSSVRPPRTSTPTGRPTTATPSAPRRPTSRSPSTSTPTSGASGRPSPPTAARSPTPRCSSEMPEEVFRAAFGTEWYIEPDVEGSGPRPGWIFP